MKMIWCGLKIKEHYHVLVNQFHGNFRSKTLGCRKFKSVFRNIKLFLNASLGLKGLNRWPLRYLTLLPIWSTLHSQTSGYAGMTMGMFWLNIIILVGLQCRNGTYKSSRIKPDLECRPTACIPCAVTRRKKNTKQRNNIYCHLLLNN